MGLLHRVLEEKGRKTAHSGLLARASRIKAEIGELTEEKKKVDSLPFNATALLKDIDSINDGFAFPYLAFSRCLLALKPASAFLIGSVDTDGHPVILARHPVPNSLAASSSVEETWEARPEEQTLIDAFEGLDSAIGSVVLSGNTWIIIHAREARMAFTAPEGLSPQNDPEGTRLHRALRPLAVLPRVGITAKGFLPSMAIKDRLPYCAIARLEFPSWVSDLAAAFPFAEPGRAFRSFVFFLADRYGPYGSASAMGNSSLLACFSSMSALDPELFGVQLVKTASKLLEPLVSKAAIAGAESIDLGRSQQPSRTLLAID